MLKISNIPGMSGVGYVYIYLDPEMDYLARRYNSEIEIPVISGKKYYIYWPTNSSLHSWVLSLQPKLTETGQVCETAIAAGDGNNVASNAAGAQWFSYTPAENGEITISTCGLTEEDTYVSIYEDCDEDYLVKSDDNCNLQTLITFDAIKGSKYLIKWRDDYTSGTYNWNLSLRPYSIDTEIESFHFEGKTISSVVNAINKTVNVLVGKTESLTSLTPTFELSKGSNAFIGATGQYSGITANNFAAPVIYTIIAEDNITETDWTITVTNKEELNDAKSILDFSFQDDSDSTVFNEFSHTIKAYVNYTTNISSQAPDFKLSPYASAYIGPTGQISGLTVNNYTANKTYSIMAEDGTTQDWVIQVIKNIKPLGETCLDPIIAVEGINYGNNMDDLQYFTYTPTESGYIIITSCPDNSKEMSLYSDCSTLEYYTWVDCYDEIKYPVEAGIPVIIIWEGFRNGSFTLTRHSATSEKEIIDIETDDQVGDAKIDQINHTIAITVVHGSDLSNQYIDDLQLSMGAKAFIGSIQIEENDLIDFTNPVTITIEAQDGTTQVYQVTVSPKELVAENNFNSFFLNGQVGNTIIDENNHTIKTGVAVGTDRTKLLPWFSTSTYSTVSIGPKQQFSGYSLVDFTDPVIYTVESESGVSQDWTVEIAEGSVQNNATDITSFRLNEQSQAAAIDNFNKTISVVVAKGTDRSSLIPTFYLSTGATAKIGSTDQIRSITANNFTAPVIYTVTSEDGLNTMEWTVLVKNTETGILTFSLAGQTSSTIDATNKTIVIEMPAGSLINNLVATHTISQGAIAKVGSTVQVSGITPNDFTNPVIIMITAENGAYYENWTVNITIASNITAIQPSTDPGVFPNPSNGMFHISLNEVVNSPIQIDIFNVNGTCVMSKSESISNGQSIDLDLSGYQPGVYYVRMQTGIKQSLLKLLLN